MNAEQKVKDKLPPPSVCRFCKSNVALVENKVIYGKNYGKWPYAYICSNESCRAYVGCHPNTKIPLGTLADKSIREARKRAKESFNKLWMKGGFMSRTEAYKILAEYLDIPIKKCHIGWMDVDICKKAENFCNIRYDSYVDDNEVNLPVSDINRKH